MKSLNPLILLTIIVTTLNKNNYTTQYNISQLKLALCKNLAFFLQKFVSGIIEKKEDVATLQKFADLLVSRNLQNHYDSEALRRKFKTHIAYATLSFVEDEYFPKGYDLCRYMRFVKSGLFGIVPVKNRKKILAKSLMMKKK